MKVHNMITELSQYGLISVSGADAKQFLQGQLTNHMDDVIQGKSILSAYCNIKGRVQAIFRIFTTGDNTYYLRLPAEILNNVLTELKKYGMFSKVQITDATNEFVKLGICADHLPENISKMENLFVLPGSPPRYELYVKEQLNELKKDFETVSSEVWDCLDIQAGIPNVYAATQNEFLPHHLNLHTLGAIHFKKGCYLGQEIIARMHYKGIIKKTIIYEKCDKTLGATLKPGDPWGEGQVVSVCETPDAIEMLVIISINA